MLLHTKTARDMGKSSHTELGLEEGRLPHGNSSDGTGPDSLPEGHGTGGSQGRGGAHLGRHARERRGGMRRKQFPGGGGIWRARGLEAGGVPGPAGQSISEGQDMFGAYVSTHKQAGTGGTATPTRQPLVLPSTLWAGPVSPVPATPAAVPLQMDASSG